VFSENGIQNYPCYFAGFGKIFSYAAVCHDYRLDYFRQLLLFCLAELAVLCFIT
jgi:hypothetical protein